MCARPISRSTDTQQQIGASSVTRMYDEEKFRSETEKLRVGKSTSFVVAQTQRDLLASRIAEVRALVNYLKGLTHLYLRDGSLLARRGIAGRDKRRLSQQLGLWSIQGITHQRYSW